MSTYIGRTPRLSDVRTGNTLPGSARLGQLFYKTDTDVLYFWDGTSWLIVPNESRTLLRSNNLSDLTNVSTARTNLDLLGGILREIVVIPYNVDVGNLPSGFTKDNAGQVTWDTTAFPWLRFVVSNILSGGGGGGSAEGGAGSAEGGGGGSGAWSQKKIDSSDLLDSEIITLGELGTGGSATGSPNDGTNGGTSSFGSHHSATGGIGGPGGVNTGGSNGGSGSNGGNATGGDLNIDGRQGGNRRVVSGSTIQANYGGVAPMGGDNYGDGGDGASTGGSNTAGIDGYPGYVTLHLYG